MSRRLRGIGRERESCRACWKSLLLVPARCSLANDRGISAPSASSNYYIPHYPPSPSSPILLLPQLPPRLFLIYSLSPVIPSSYVIRHIILIVCNNGGGREDEQLRVGSKAVAGTTEKQRPYQYGLRGAVSPLDPHLSQLIGHGHALLHAKSAAIHRSGSSAISTS